MSADAKPHHLDLIAALESLAALLRRYGEAAWASKIEDDALLVRRGDSGGAARFLSYFGAMGSLNDLWLCEANGHPMSAADENAANASLDEAKGKAFKLATTFTRED
jgi:hypothetical protein